MRLRTFGRIPGRNQIRKRRCFNRSHEVLLDAQLPGQCVDSFDRFMPRATKETNYDYYIPAGQGRFHKLFLRARSMFENRYKSLNGTL